MSEEENEKERENDHQLFDADFAEFRFSHIGVSDFSNDLTFSDKRETDHDNGTGDLKIDVIEEDAGSDSNLKSGPLAFFDHTN